MAAGRRCHYHSPESATSLPDQGASIMFSYERHMVVALAIAVIAIVAVVSIVVLGIPLPFLDK
jgi:hypothetical protein